MLDGDLGGSPLLLFVLFAEHDRVELLPVDVRRMRRRKGVGEDREPVYRFVSRGEEWFARFEVLIVRNVGGQSVSGGGRRVYVARLSKCVVGEEG